MCYLNCSFPYYGIDFEAISNDSTTGAVRTPVVNLSNLPANLNPFPILSLIVLDFSIQFFPFIFPTIFIVSYCFKILYYF